MVMPVNQPDERQLLSLLEEAMDFAIYRVAVDPDNPYGGKVMMVSPSIKRIVGIKEPERFETWFEQLHPEDLPRVTEANQRSWQERVVYDQTARFYNALKGQWIWIHTISTPVLNAKGELSHYTGVIVDITQQKEAELALQRAHEELEQRVVERTQALAQANQALQSEVNQRKQAEESLRISQALYAEVFDNSPLQIFIIDALPDGRFRVLRTNLAHQRGSGLPPEQIWGKTIDELVVPEVAENITRHYRACIAAGRPIEYEEQGPAPYWDLEHIRSFRTTLSPVYNSQGQVFRLIGASEDITDQKQAEQILMNRAREEAVTAERGRLARELHDAVTQTLFSTALTSEVLPRIWERSPEEGRKKLEEIRELTRGALAEMRTLLVELRPDALADAELKDLLQHLTNAFIARSRIPAQFSSSGTPALPIPTKVAFYRIAQETLSNIAKHSEASRVTIHLSCQPEQTTLSIEDNGQGFQADQAIKAGHYGLSIMRERAEQVGAVLSITSQPGRGTQTTLAWNPQPPPPPGEGEP